MGLFSRLFGAKPVKTFDVEEELRTIDAMEGHDFEYYCADLLRDRDFTNVEVTQGSGDYGVDIIAWKSGVKYAIQCKRYRGNVGNRSVQEIYTGARLYNCQKAIVLTNSYFTQNALNTATATGVILWGRNALREMLETKRWNLYEDNSKWPHNRASRIINTDYYNSLPSVPLYTGMRQQVKCYPIGGETENFNPYLLIDEDPELNYMVEFCTEPFASADEAEHFLRAVTKRYFVICSHSILYDNDGYLFSAYAHAKFIADKFDFNNCYWLLENYA